MTTESNGVSLDELVDPKTAVEIRGQLYAVRPIDGFGMQLVQNTPKDRGPMIDTMYRIAARCLKPHFTFDQVFGTEEVIGFSEAEVMSVIEAAQSQAKKVEATASPNSGPAGERETSPLTS